MIQCDHILIKACLRPAETGECVNISMKILTPDYNVILTPDYNVILTPDYNVILTLTNVILTMSYNEEVLTAVRHQSKI